MLTNFGDKLETFPVKDFRTISDLIYYDGPILSHASGEKNREYLVYWVDQDDEIDRWLLFEISLENLYYFLNKEKSLRELIMSNKFVFLVDDKSNSKVVSIIESSELPAKYIPSENYYYAFNMPTEYMFLAERYGDEAKQININFICLLQNKESSMYLEYMNSYIKKGKIFDFA